MVPLWVAALTVAHAEPTEPVQGEPVRLDCVTPNGMTGPVLDVNVVRAVLHGGGLCEHPDHLLGPADFRFVLVAAPGAEPEP